MESTRSSPLRGQERVARLEVVELIDRHHVDGAHPIDLGAEIADHLVGRQRAGHRGAALPSGLATCAARTRPAASSTSAASGVSSTALGLASRPSCSICATSAATSSSDACTSRRRTSRGGRGRIRRSRAATSRCDASSRTASSALRASRMRLLLRVELLRAAPGTPRPPSATCSRRSSNVRRSSSSCRSDAAIASRSSSRRDTFRCSSSARVTTRCSSSRARVLQPLHLDRQRAAALDERRVRRLGFRGHPRLVGGRLARLEQLPLRRRQLFVGRRAARSRCAESTPAPRPRAAPARAAPLPRCGARARSVPASATRGRPLRRPWSPAGRSRRSAFSWRCSSAWSDAIADSTAAMSMSRPAASSSSRTSAAPFRRRRARGAP